MRKSVHTPVVSKADLVRIVPPDKLGPNSPLLEKARKKRTNPEHDAQVRLFEKLDESDDHKIIRYRPVIHAIPQFVGADESWRSKKHGGRYKAEGQRPGMPDAHVPVPVGIGGWGAYDSIVVASLYVELKFESYPSESQREMFRMLADAGNAVVVIRFPSVEDLALRAYDAIREYLYGNRNFTRYSHEKFTYLPPGLL